MSYPCCHLQAPGDGVFVKRIYDDGRSRYHYTDGIILAPNTPYITGTNSHYFKWKWCDQVTIDLRACFETSQSMQVSWADGLLIALSQLACD